MSDHREDIREAAQRQTAAVREGLDDPENDYGLDGAGVLDVEVWHSNYDRTRVEFTLTVGGPTVRVTVDEFDNVTFHHSWGKDPNTGEDRTEWPVANPDAIFWQDLADEYDELIHPKEA